MLKPTGTASGCGSAGTKRLAKADTISTPRGSPRPVAGELGLCPVPDRSQRFRDEPFGNLTITVTPDEPVNCACRSRWSIWQRQTRPLRSVRRQRSPIVNTSGWRGSPARGRCPTITRAGPGRALSHRLRPSTEPDFATAGSPDIDVCADGSVVGVDLNDGHLALRRLDEHGNPVGNRRGSASTCRVRPRVATPKSATPSPG